MGSRQSPRFMAPAQSKTPPPRNRGGGAKILRCAKGQDSEPLRAFSSKKRAWLARAETSEGWNGFVMR